MLDKENMNPTSNSPIIDSPVRSKGRKELKKKSKKKMSVYLQAMNARDFDIGAKSFCKLFESAFQRNDENLNCQRLQLLVLLIRAVIDRFEDLSKIFDELLNEYRFLLHLSSAPVSSDPNDTYHIEEYMHYFRQWFKSLCRCMLSLHILQEGKCYYFIPREDETYRCMQDPQARKKQYFSLRSIHSIDRLYREAAQFFANKNDVEEAIENSYLRIPNISMEIFDKQRLISGFMIDQVRSDLEKVGFKIITFSVESADRWRFHSKSAPVIVVTAYGQEVSIGYDNKVSLSSHPFTDTAKFKALERRSDFLGSILTSSSKGLGFSTELPALPQITPIQVLREVRPSVNDQEVSDQSGEALPCKALETMLEEEGESMPEGAAPETIQQEGESPPPERLQVEPKTLWDDYKDDASLINKDAEEQQQLILASNSQDVEDLLWDEGSTEQQQEVTKARRSITTRSSTAQAGNVFMDAVRVDDLLNQPLEFFTMDQSVSDCYNVCREVVKDSVLSMFDNETTAITCLKAFLRRALHERLLQNKTKGAIKLQISQMFLGLYDETRKEKINNDMEKVRCLPQHDQDHLFQKRGKSKQSPWQKHVNKISTRFNRVFLSVACTFWDEVCDEYFSKNPLFLSKLLEFDHVPKNAFDSYWSKWQEMKIELKHQTDFFEQFDVVQFAVQLKNTEPGEEKHNDKKMLTQLLTIGEKEEDYAFTRVWLKAKSYAIAAATPNYKEAISTTSQKRRKPSIKSIEQRTPSKKQKTEETVAEEAAGDEQSAIAAEYKEVKADDEVVESFHDEADREQLTFDEAMKAIGNCFSNTYLQLGIELTVMLGWAVNRTAVQNGIHAAIVGLLKQYDQIEFHDEATILEVIEKAFFDTLHLVMILRVKEDEIKYNVTPPNGQCFYLLHYQLYRRAANNYQLPMNDLAKYLINSTEYINALQAEQARLTVACWELDDVKDHELKARMKSLVIKIPHVVKHVTNPESPRFMERIDQSVVNKAIGDSRWGSPAEGATLFFAPELSLSMALFHDMEDVFEHKSVNLANADNIRNLANLGDKPAIFVTSTSTANAPLYCATMKDLLDSCKGLNFGMFDGNHFFPIAITDRVESIFVDNLKQAYKALCMETLKVFKKIDKNELIGDLNIKMRTYELNYKGGRAGKQSSAPSSQAFIKDLTTPVKEQVITTLEQMEMDAAEEIEEEVAEEVAEEVEEEEEKLEEAITLEKFLIAAEGDVFDLLHGRKKATLAAWEEFGTKFLRALNNMMKKK